MEIGIIESEREFYLDLSKNKLFGFEKYKNALVVAAMCAGVKLGHVFPARDIIEICDSNYEIVNGLDENQNYWEYGGHHRALAYYIEEVPLKCRLLRDHRVDISRDKFIHIGDIWLNGRHSPVKLVDTLHHLHRDIAERFCQDNNLDPSKYLLPQVL